MRYFTDEELVKQSRPLADLALEAVEAGQVQQLHYLLNEMDQGHAGLCGLGLQWLPRMWGKIRTDFGEDVLDGMLGKSSFYLMEPYVEEFLGGDEKGVVSQIIRMWMYQHGANIVPLGETDEEVAFSLTPCGSGGKVLLSGWPQSLPDVLGPCSDGTPIFCRGCKALQKAFNEACGAEAWTTEINQGLLGGCTMRFFKQKSKGQSLFEPLELYQVVKSRCRQAIEKILAGDLNIRELIKDQHREWLPYHDLMISYAVCIQAEVYREKGSEYLDTFLKESYDTSFAMFYPAHDALDDLGLLRMFVQTWHYHQATFRVEEEENRFAFILDPCGSGGRMYRGDMHKGRFQYGTGMPCLMKEPANINFNRKDYPVYCTHCASSNRDQYEGNPFVFVIDGHAMKDPNSPCVQYLYKKDAKREVSPEMLAHVGKTEVTPRP
jgi:hypothetical protein